MDYQMINVPAHLVSKVYAFIAELMDAEERSAASEPRPRSGLDEEAVAFAYGGGVSEHWRPFLDRLAAEPDEWVSWSTLCDAIGLSPRQASGMLGAAERRLHRQPPYERKTLHNERWFRMSAETAKLVQRQAAIHRRLDKA